MSWRDALRESFLGRMLQGLLLLLLAGIIVPLAASLTQLANQMTVTVGNQKIQLGIVISLIVAFLPLLLLKSALEKLGIHI